MTASIKFTAAQSNKIVRITDTYPAIPDPKTSKLLKAGDASSFFTFVFETFDEKTGLVKVEVSSDGNTFATQEDEKRVEHGQQYPIDDSKLPKAKKDRQAA